MSNFIVKVIIRLKILDRLSKGSPCMIDMTDIFCGKMFLKSTPALNVKMQYFRNFFSISTLKCVD